MERTEKTNQRLNEICCQTPGWVARHINKPISLWITKRLLRTSISPNQISCTHFLFGVVGCTMITSRGYGWRALGALLLQISSILDGCDGEVAKLKNKESRLGAWLDTIFDDVVNNLLLIAIVVGLTRTNLFYGSVGLIVIVASLGISFAIYLHLIFLVRSANAADFRLSWQLTSTTAGPFEKLKPILKRDFFILVAAILILVDLRSLLFWLATFSILPTFVLYMASTFHLFIKSGRQKNPNEA